MLLMLTVEIYKKYFCALNINYLSLFNIHIVFVADLKSCVSVINSALNTYSRSATIDIKRNNEIEETYRNY